MKVLMISPGYPADLQLFTRGLARVGATVLGVGDQPKQALAPDVAEALSAYLPVKQLWDEDSTVEEIAQWLSANRVEVDLVECLWEPGVVLAAKVRQRLGVPGLSVEQAIRFRDKETMKATLDAAGIRTPHHYRASTKDEVREAAEKIGFPVIVKPIAGAGSADTWPAESGDELEKVLGAMDHVEEVSVEEFVQGDEFTFDCISANGRVLFQNVAWYRPKPLYMRLYPWISPRTICFKDLEMEEVSIGVEMGHQVLSALEFGSGMTHMEWFRTPDGEAVFGEIGARAPGGKLTHGMNLSCDIDLFTGWAEAVTAGRLSQDTTKKFNVGMVFKRAKGDGQVVSRIEGLEPLLAEIGEFLPIVDLVSVGAPRRDHTREVTGDGLICVRHPDLRTTMQWCDRIAEEVRVLAD